jgi:hypothetical protein
MRNVVRLAQLAMVSGFALIGTGIPSLAAAAGNLEAHLRGSYAFTTARTCTNSSTEPLPTTNPPFQFGPSGVFRQASSDNGIITFNGDGKGSAVGSSKTMDISAPSGPLVTISTFTSDFDYSVNPDGTVEVTNQTSTFESTFGRGVGDRGTVTGQQGRWQISHGNTMLVSAPPTDFSVETVAFTPLTNPPFTRYRICVRSTTLTMLPGK